MQLANLDIVNFKNIQQAGLEFCPGLNCLLGRNGMGKSNLLEAIHFLCLARPMSQMPESQLILHGQQSMMVKGDFLSDSGALEKVSCGIAAGKGKSVRHNGKPYDRLSEHVGRFPVVTVTPADSRLVTDGSEERRRLADIVLSQSDPVYLANLIRYRRSLDSRNRMLRAGMKDPLLFESVEHALCESAAAISAARGEWTRAIAPDVKRFYNRISAGAEEAALEYSSALLSEGMQQLLDRNRERDRILGHTSAGVHRDDFPTLMDGRNMRRLGSQGQVKTFTVALRLAIFEYLRSHSGLTPLLLLDDIFDKLDSTRVGRIMELVSDNASDGFRQIFITDTNREHLDEILSALQGESRLFQVADGSFDLIPNP